MGAGRVQPGVLEYRDIPYAAAPVGDRRFAAPDPDVRWDGVRRVATLGANAP